VSILDLLFPAIVSVAEKLAFIFARTAPPESKKFLKFVLSAKNLLLLAKHTGFVKRNILWLV